MLVRGTLRKSCVYMYATIVVHYNLSQYVS